uniref:Ig-like domain-containing protein n=1 Tax=Chelonoidis abingdonii TaxID=106734 RepID=A0A8C0HHH0_CHEAB
MEQPLEGVRGPTHCASRAGLCLGLSMGTGHEFRKPIIWVSPSRVVALGGSVTIRCEGQDPGMTFFLHKAGHLNLQRQMVPDGPVAEFPIPSIGREDGGNYTCDYQSITDQNRWSNLSDPIEIIVAGEGYPKPSISISPRWGVSLGGAVTVRCWGQRQDMRFMLNKEGRHFPPVDSDGFEAEFSSSNVRREYGGSYSCSYHSRSEPFTMSYPSDPMELVVRGEGPGSASLFPAPGPAGSRLCPRHSRGEARPGSMDGLGRPGLGECLDLALTACLLCADPSLPRPNISLSPTGADVTIRCQGQRQDVRFFLHKAGDLNPQRHMDPAGAGAEFHIPSVGRQHGGSYSCSYRPRSEPFVSSQPSDTVQLVVTSKRPGSVSPALPVSVGSPCYLHHLLCPLPFLSAGNPAFHSHSHPTCLPPAPSQPAPAWGSPSNLNRPPPVTASPSDTRIVPRPSRAALGGVGS